MFQPTFCNTIFWTWYTMFLFVLEGFDFISNYVWLCKVWTYIRMGHQWWCECQSVVVSAFYLQTLRNVAQPTRVWLPRHWLGTRVTSVNPPLSVWDTLGVDPCHPCHSLVRGTQVAVSIFMGHPGCRTLSNSAHHHYQDTLFFNSWCLQFEGRKHAI